MLGSSQHGQATVEHATQNLEVLAVEERAVQQTLSSAEPLINALVPGRTHDALRQLEAGTCVDEATQRFLLTPAGRPAWVGQRLCIHAPHIPPWDQERCRPGPVIISRCGTFALRETLTTRA